MSVQDAEEAAFLALLRCPLCAKRPALRYDRESEVFSCAEGLHRFPRVDGFPALRPDDVLPAEPPKEV
jgi:uncharacterized protein YbaR (Trm112 family)